MEEKIKIYVPQSVNAILLKDMENFEFFKKDGSLNKNEFYNTLIVNYYEQYDENQSEIYSHIKESIHDNASLNDSVVNDIAADILQYIDVRTFQLNKQKYDTAIAMKPTRYSSSDIEYIQSCLLSSSTLSNYFRNMFASYALLPQDKRETIIFKPIYDRIREAIDTDRKIYFTTDSSKQPHIASPYAVSNSKEELFNYLICKYHDAPYSFRLCRIDQVKILNEAREFSEEMIEVFQKMIRFGPQFSYEMNKANSQIKVLLSERGKKQFRMMYLHRPQPVKTEGDIYYFDCSRGQAFQYFARFGRNAVVLEPKDLQADLHKFYATANQKYKKAARLDTEYDMQQELMENSEDD